MIMTKKKYGVLPKDFDPEKILDELMLKIGAKEEGLVIEEFGTKLERLNKTGIEFIDRMLEDVMTLYHMISNENYTPDEGVRKMIVAALYYFIQPVDAIPDYIPVTGYFDDAIVIGTAVHILYSKIEAYRREFGETERPVNPQQIQ